MCPQANGCACGATRRRCASRWDSGVRATGRWIGRPDGRCCRRRTVTASGFVSSRPGSRTGTRVRCAKKEDNSCSCKGWPAHPYSLIILLSLLRLLPSLTVMPPCPLRTDGTRAYLSLSYHPDKINGDDTYCVWPVLPHRLRLLFTLGTADNVI